MEEGEQYKKKFNPKGLVYLFFLLLVFIGGFVVSKYLMNNSDNSANKDYVCNCDSVVKKLIESGGCDFLKDDAPIKSLSGKITKIASDKLVLKVNDFEILSDSSLESRAISVNSSTKIIQFKDKDKELYERELDEFYKTRDNYNTEDEFLLNKPSYQIMSKIPFSDLAVNEVIIVRSNEDIRYKKEILADEIIVK